MCMARDIHTDTDTTHAQTQTQTHTHTYTHTHTHTHSASTQAAHTHTSLWRRGHGTGGSLSRRLATCFARPSSTTLSSSPAHDICTSPSARQLPPPTSTPSAMLALDLCRWASPRRCIASAPLPPLSGNDVEGEMAARERAGGGCGRGAAGGGARTGGGSPMSSSCSHAVPVSSCLRAVRAYQAW